MTTTNIRQVAVLGAGVMGAQIAAHLINMRVPVLLFDLPAQEGPKSAIAMRAIEGLKKLKPAPLGWALDAALITPANYDEHLGELKNCDLIIEAVAERMDIKRALFEKIVPALSSSSIVVSNTSGLSVKELAKALPAHWRERFCGVHFFNPPRYMQLVELIPTAQTHLGILDALETFLTSVLGKSVVRAKDTPNFIANRVGVANMLSTMHEAERLGLGYDLVDELTGKKLGRASSGTFRTADVVGLDTLMHVIKTMQDQLPDDPFASLYATPPVLASLVAQGALGQKNGAGFYKKVGKEILQWAPGSGTYVHMPTKADEIIGRMLKKPPAERLKLLRESKNPQAQFLWAILRNSFHYAAVHLHSIARCARDVDLAFRWGFGAEQGPFELWQQAGWKTVAQWVQEDIDAGKALCRAPLPAWVTDGRDGVHTPQGSWSTALSNGLPRSMLTVYRRQHFRQGVFGDGQVSALESGRELAKSEELRMWTLDGQAVIASITAKLHLISPLVVQGLLESLDVAEKNGAPLVIWSPDDVFSAGANLEGLMPKFMQGGAKAIEPEEKNLQDLMMRLRYARVPVVAAMRGLALGGGCELALHCTRRVAAFESYIGLVEAGVGLLPGAGGLTHIARRAAQQASANGAQGDLLTFLREPFTHVATARVSTSALEARQLGYLQDDDVIVPHQNELLFVALTQAQALLESGYRPPLKTLFPVAGRSVKATIQAQLVNLQAGGMASEHDIRIGTLVADVLCGGDVDAGTLVSDEYLLALERTHFSTLLMHPKTHERIMGMLSTGKPVRN